jgi:hypothetical protein
MRLPGFIERLLGCRTFGPWLMMLVHLGRSLPR